MFDKFKRRHCPFRVCNGKDLKDSRHCTTAFLCGICDHPIFNPCGTCSNYKFCDFEYKDKDIRHFG